jgi:phage terminase large subunit-like protein
MLRFGLRMGSSPRAAVTTTPRAVELVKRLAAAAEAGRGGVVMTRARTADNARNLAPGFVEALQEAYGGGAVARTELEGLLAEEVEGALWRRGTIARAEALGPGGYERVVVAVDPPAGVGGAACGIVAAGLARGVVHVLQDGSVRGLSPMGWAGRAVALAQAWGAGVIVAEGNQGGEMVKQLLEMAGAVPEAGIVVRMRHAAEAKLARAYPVAALYEQGRAAHAGVFRELEDEMCAYTGAAGDRSPDRLDALVWAVMELARTAPRPAIRRL